MSRQQCRGRKALSVAWALLPAYTLGFLAPAPFLHAAFRLRTRVLWLAAGGYLTAWVVFWVLVSSGPENSDAPNTAAENAGVILLFTMALVGTVHALALRRAVFGPARSARQPVTAAVAEPVPAACAQLRTELASLQSYVSKYAASFPASCAEQLEEILQQLEQTLSYAEATGVADSELAPIRVLLTDYLPTSINTYLQLPAEYAQTHENPDGRTPAQELHTHLSLLHENATEIANSLYRRSALRMQTKSAYLSAKFGKSELDLR